MFLRKTSIFSKWYLVFCSFFLFNLTNAVDEQETTLLLSQFDSDSVTEFVEMGNLNLDATSNEDVETELITLEKDGTAELEDNLENVFLYFPNKSKLTISKTDGLSNGNKLVAGVEDTTFLKFVLDNNDAGDVDVTSVTIKGIGFGLGTNYNSFRVAIFVDGIQQGSSRRLDKHTGEATFNDLAVVIPSEGQTEFEVAADTISEVRGFKTTLRDGVTAKPIFERLVSGSGSVAAGSKEVVVENILPYFVSSYKNLVIVNDGADINSPNAEMFSLKHDVYRLEAERTITAKSPLNNLHPPNSDIYTTSRRYYPGTKTFSFYDTFLFEIGDEVIFGDNVFTCEITNILGSDITCLQASNSFFRRGDRVWKKNSSIIGIPSNIRLIVTNIDANNVENGQSVTIQKGNVALGKIINENGENQNCDIDGVETNASLEGDTTDTSVQNYLCGSRLSLIESGKLTIEQGPRTDGGNILIGGEEDVEVFKLKLSAADDEIQIKDLYFVNNGSEKIQDRVTFKLYDDTGELIQQKQMNGGTLHFELPIRGRIRIPKDDSVTITIKVDVRGINKSNQTGERLILALSTADGTSNKGVEAVTAAIGLDLIDEDITIVGSPISKEFIAYRTALTIRHSFPLIRPKIEIPSNDFQEIYRFEVESDSAYKATIERLSLDISFHGMFYGGSGTTSYTELGSILAKSEDFKLLPVNIENNKTCYSCNEVAQIGVAQSTNKWARLNLDFFDENLEGKKIYALFMKELHEDQNGSPEDNGVSIGFLPTDSYRNQSQTSQEKKKEGANFIWTDNANYGGLGPWLNGYLLDISQSIWINGLSYPMQEIVTDSIFFNGKLRFFSQKNMTGGFLGNKIVVEIQEGTIIEKDEQSAVEWDGSLEPPTSCLVPSIDGIIFNSCMKTGSDRVKLRLSKPAKIRIPFDGPNGIKTVYTSHDGNSWVPEFTCEVVDGFCEFMTDHFTYFAVGEVVSVSSSTGGGPSSHPSIDVCLNGKIQKAYPHKSFGKDIYKTYKSCRKNEIECLTDWVSAVGLSLQCKTFPKENVTKVSKEESEDLVLISTSCEKEKLKLISDFTIPKSSPFKDVSKNNLKYKFVLDLFLQGIISGENNSGKMNLTDSINRAEVSKIIAIANEAEIFISEACNKTDFPDVSSNKWFAKYVRYMKSQKIINGYKNGQFGPEDKITYGQVIKIMARTFNLISSDTIEPNGKNWPQPYFEVLLENNILPKELIDNNNWNLVLTRGQVFEILWKILKL